MRVVIADDAVLLREGAARLLEEAGCEVVARAEGVGYLLKDRIAEVERLGEAVQRVAAGGSVLDPEVVAQMLGRARQEGPLDTLTGRERQVLELMAEGRTNRAIAAELFISERGIERHVTSIFTKLGLPTTDQDHRRVLAVLAYLRP